MATKLQGKESLLFFRRYEDRETESAAKLFFQTEHSIEKTKETETTQTKDGQTTTVSDGENTISITSLAYAEDDGVVALWEELEDWFDANDKVEVWEVSKGLREGEQFRARYFQGHITDFSISAPADGDMELEMTYAIDGNGTKGAVTLTDEQQQVASYVFTDLDPVTAGA